MKEITFQIEKAIEGGYHTKALEAGIFTEGNSLDEVKKNIQEAVRCHFDEDELPKQINHILS